jgi:F-box-like
MEIAGLTTDITVVRPLHIILTTADRQIRRNADRVTSMDTLPDEILLAIFGFCAEDEIYYNRPRKERVELWQTLAHVCQRWRIVVFGSPRRLNLQLVCTPGTPVLETLDVWPVFPLIIHCHCDYPHMDNILAALKRSDRICRIVIEHSKRLSLKKALALMQAPFPELTHLTLWSHYERKTVLPDSFLNGSATCLQCLDLDAISFPGLPKLLLSATHLVYLSIRHIHHPGYISPEVMVTCLSTSTSLESLNLGFLFPPSYPVPENQPLHLSTRSVLPALTQFVYRGLSENLEDFVSRIDAPRFNNFSILLFDEDHNGLPQVDQLVDRTPSLQTRRTCPTVAYF